MSRLRSSLASSKLASSTTSSRPISQHLRPVPPPPPASPPAGDDAGQPPIDADGPPSRPRRPGPPPRSQLAIRSDLTVLLAVDDLSNHDLTGRVFWTCIELTPDEAQFARERGIEAEQEIAAKLIGKIPKRRDPGGN